MPLLFVNDDLTKMSVDAIVSEPGIVSRTGTVYSSVLNQASEKTRKKISRKLRFRNKNHAILTEGYDFPARYIIHTFRPIWDDGTRDEQEKLQNGYTHCLQLAVSKQCETVAFPLISNNPGPDSKEMALNAAVSAITSFLADHELTVYLVLSDRYAFSKGLALFREMKHFIDVSDFETPLEDSSVCAPDYAETTILNNTGVIWYPANAHEQNTVEELFQKPEPRSSDTVATPRPAAPLPQMPSAEEHFFKADSIEPDEESGNDAEEFFQPGAPSMGRPPMPPSPPSAPSMGQSPMPPCPSPVQHTATEKKEPLKKPMAPSSSSYFRTEDLSRDEGFISILDVLLDNLDDGFSDSLLHLIDRKGMTDVQCYKKANISRKLFSKIRSDACYRPSKTTVIAFALALELTLPETQALLASAGYALSRSFKFDRIIEYCISQKVYNVFTVNEVLFAFDQSLLGG